MIFFIRYFLKQLSIYNKYLRKRENVIKNINLASQEYRIPLEIG